MLAKGVSTTNMYCMQEVVRTSTSPVAMEGETAYFVLRPGMPFCACANEVCRKK